MTGETQKAVSGWTVDTLKEHLDDKITGNDQRYEQRFKLSEDAVRAALLAQQDATRIAGLISEKRMDGLNELRSMAEDQATVYAEHAKMYIPRGEAMAEVRNLQQNLDSHEKVVNELANRLNVIQGERAGVKETKETSIATIGIIVAAVGVVSGVLGSVLATIMRPMGHG